MPRLTDDTFRQAHLRAIEHEVLQRLGSEREEAIFLDADGAVIYRKTGEADQVVFTDEELAALPGVVDLYTHNHPSGGGIGATDLLFAAFLGVREVNAFGSAVRYRMFLTGGQWPPRSRLESLLETAAREVRDRLQSRVNAYRLTPAEASRQFWHEVCMRLAARLDGVRYVVEER